ncbi:MAG: FKBP-type peptidyl-prolyl cis-trans isomerase [Muribaculaceae bacterium]|nr:FKBP-type peptidyl-prolyl cis-trans isomerase [Muribaculaceae bacterium]
MKKSQIFYVATATLLAGGLLASCGNKKQTETIEEEAVEESFTPGEKTEAVDSLQVIDEMVQAVETSVNGINGTKYNAAFFDNAANKGDKATADQYAQTASGLKYVIANEGNGKSPSATDKVTVHYVGTLTDGAQFDSSIDRGEPIEFPLNRVIPGWTEGLQLMKEGGTAVFYIPSNLAYGPQELPGIPANSPLIFWVQLLQVN